MIYQFENKWQQHYYHLILIVFTFIFPLFLLSDYDAPWATTARITVFVLFLAVSAVIAFFTGIRGEAGFLERIRNDKGYLWNMTFRMVGIGGILVIFFFMK